MSLLRSAFIALAFLAGAAQAQRAPTAGEVAGFSPLFTAAHAGDAGAVRAALAAEDVNAVGANGRTAAHVAGFAANHAALRALAEAGADMNALDGQLYDVVTIAAVANDPVTLSMALELGNRPDLVTSVWNGTALIAAAHLGHHEVVRLLIEAGAPLDHVNNLGWTALIEAVVLGDGGPDHVETLRLLVEAGADRTIADRAGATPLDLASARGYGEMVEILAR